MDSDDYSSDEPDEIVHLQNVNDQLHADLDRLQNQFNEMLNSYPRVEEINKENNLLKKKLVDANIQIEDYKRRLNISQNSNISQKRKIQSDQSNENKELLSQINQLKAKISDMNDCQQQKNDDFFHQMKKNEKHISKLEQEKNYLNTQISNIISLSTNYFHIQFDNVQSLCDFLMHPQPLISDFDQNDSQKKQQKDLLIQEKNEKKKIDENKFKKLYNDEKMKRKKLELDLLKFKKTQETNSLNKEQQKEMFTDLEIKYQNELRQIETNYKKEIQQLKTKDIITNPKAYKSAETQISLSIDKQINPEVINDFDYDTESAQKQDQKAPTETANNNPFYINQPQQQQNTEHQYTVDEVNHLIEQRDNLNDLLLKSEEKILKLRQKQKQSYLTIKKLKKFVIQARKKNSNLKKRVVENENVIKNNENINQEQEFVSPNDHKNTLEEVKSLKHSMKLIQELTTNQATDTQKLMADRDKLINILLLQNQYIHNSEGVIQRLQQKTEKQTQLLNSNEIAKIEGKSKNDKDEEKEKEKEIENINWQLDNFPESIVSLTKPIAENECLPIKARIRHVMAIMAKWATNLDSNYNKMMNKNDENTNQLNKKYDHLISSVLAALGEQNDEADEKEVINKVTELSNNNLILQQRNNELESMAHNDEKKVNQQAPTTDEMNELQEALNDAKESLKRKNIELKECKNAFIECQNSSNVEIEALRDSNSRVRNELNNLQTNYNNLNEQYTLLLAQIDKLKESHQEELAEKDNEFERLQSSNSNHVRDIQKQIKKSIETKDHEIEALQNQLDDANKTIETFQESTRMTIEDINQSKIKLEKYKNKSKEQQNAMKQKEKKFAEIEKHYVNTIKNLQEQNRVLREDNRVQEAADKLRQAEEMISQLETKVIKLNYQIQQDSMKSKSEIDQLERNNKLLIVQNKAKLMSVETDCSIKCDQLKTVYETEKKDFLGYIVQNFKQFFDLRNEMSESSIKEAIIKIKNELTFLKNLENSIRKLINAQEGQSTEDALTDLIISMHPQLQ